LCAEAAFTSTAHELVGGALAAAALLAAVHVFSQKLRILDGVPRSRLLSAVGGMAVAFVILRLLPAIASHQQTIEKATRGTVLANLNNHVWIMLLASLVLFYGLEHLAKISRAKSQRGGGPDQTTAPVFWIHMGTFALISVLLVSF
jgi:phosphate/sulfate permease